MEFKISIFDKSIRESNKVKGSLENDDCLGCVISADLGVPNNGNIAEFIMEIIQL